MPRAATCVGQSVSQPVELARAGKLLREEQKLSATAVNLFLSMSITATFVLFGTGTVPLSEQSRAKSTLSFGRCLMISKVPLMPGL